MATIKDFDKIRQDVVRPYNVVRPSLLAKTAMCCHVSASIPRLKDSLYAYSLSSAMPKSKAQSSVPSYLSKIAALNKSLNASASATLKLKSREIINFGMLSKCSAPAETNHLAESLQDLCLDPTIETNAKLDSLIAISEENTEIYELMRAAILELSENSKVLNSAVITQFLESSTNEKKQRNIETRRFWISTIIASGALIFAALAFFK